MNNMQMLILVGLAVVVVGALAYALLYNSIASDKKSKERMQRLQMDKKTKMKVESRKMDEKQRRKSREAALKNVDDQKSKGKTAGKETFREILEQAGFTISLGKFYVVSAVIGILFFFIALVFMGATLPIAGGVGFVMGFGAPRWWVKRKRKKRFAAFTKTFPNAIDVIVRGIKSGLPLNDCLRIIATDSDEPVRGEFRKLIEAAQMGIPVPEACERLYKSIPTSETNFFSIVIAIQSSAGGNLSEALGNLSKVLRERRKMADKIQAFSSEAKTSTMIIGALPFVVAIMVFATSPYYLVPLWTTTGGHKVLFFCAVSMGFGILVMKKMINFKF
ncbi:type II secretion system F family protein [Ahrensia sp. R2A130]|uniref:type II secretion system F family protein n=1 Tax=Ahrensia sp. R2A130 TaxID=744979 RepID=UPI0001E0E095|nr:type II secretion system F family protein [Ahrensia sp. R2A130]EFL89843.1 type II secretion system protein [Ahrensia sp. R2A130]